jgi:hypothetical protein
MTVLTIQRYINSDGLLPFLGLLGEHASAPDLAIDFSGLQRVSPAGLAALTAFVAGRKQARLTTTVTGLDVCGIRGYLSRMNLLRLCGWEPEDEAFARNDPRGRFVPLAEIPPRVDDLGHQIAECIAPGGEDYEHSNADLYDTAWYLVTEMANNVRQHSRGIGFVAAQTTLSDGFIRIAIADCGCGIAGSLKESGLTWTQGLPDEDIIEQAMAARVSSKGQPSNEGVGLTLSSRIVELMGGHMLVASGAGTVIRRAGLALKKAPLPNGIRFPGTLIAISFRRSEASDFDSKLLKAKELEHLLRRAAGSATFEP